MDKDILGIINITVAVLGLDIVGAVCNKIYFKFRFSIKIELNKFKLKNAITNICTDKGLSKSNIKALNKCLFMSNNKIVMLRAYINIKNMTDINDSLYLKIEKLMNQYNYKIQKFISNSHDVVAITSLHKYLSFSKFIYGNNFFQKKGIFPIVYEMKDKKIYNSNELFNYIMNNSNDILLEALGGSGKTFTLLSLWQMCLIDMKENSVLPIFISLKELNANLNSSMIDFICANYLGTSNREILFDLIRENTVLFLIDGFNEIEYSKRCNIIKEYENIMQQEYYENVKFIFTNRFGISGFEKFYEKNVMYNYVCKMVKFGLCIQKESVKQILLKEYDIILNDRYLRKLNLPFYLNIFLIIYNPENKVVEIEHGKLIKAFIEEWDLNNYRNKYINNAVKIAELYLIINYILPNICYYLSSSNSLSLKSEILSNLIEKELNKTILSTEFIKSHHKYIILENEDVYNDIISLMTNNELNYLYYNKDTLIYYIAHEHFRDYFSACYLLNDYDIRISNNLPPKSDILQNVSPQVVIYMEELFDLEKFESIIQNGTDKNPLMVAYQAIGNYYMHWKSTKLNIELDLSLQEKINSKIELQHKAVTYFIKSADLGDDYSKWATALIYRRFAEDSKLESEIRINYAQNCLKISQELYEKKYPYGINSYAVICRNGFVIDNNIVLEKNEDKALTIFETAAALGVVHSMNGAGKIYEDRALLYEDLQAQRILYHEAFDYYLKSANRQDSYGMRKVAEFILKNKLPEKTLLKNLNLKESSELKEYAFNLLNMASYLNEDKEVLNLLKEYYRKMESH